jgi:hypothetical protein
LLRLHLLCIDILAIKIENAIRLGNDSLISNKG